MFWFSSKDYVYNQGFLNVSNDHTIYYQQIGNPQGEPVLMFHGGPGGKSKAKFAKVFNLKKYRIIQFDQRGCGKSKYKDLLKDNSTSELIEDAYKLLIYLKIQDQVIVTGASWGSTLALLFAEKYPQKTKSLVLSLIFLAREQDLAWLRQDSRRFYPDIYDLLAENANGKNFFDYYNKLLNTPNPKDQMLGYNLLGKYEGILGSLSPRLESEGYDERKIYNARIFFHYERHNYFLEPDEILQKSNAIKDIPTIIFHNRLDFCCPVYQAWDLKQALPNARLEIIADYGHGSKKQFNLMKQEVNKFLACYQHNK